MRFTFISNYINHHQKPFCDAMYALMGEDFCFVQTMPMEQERVAMGWSTELTRLPYVRLLYEDAEARRLIEDSECVLLGWSEREDIAQSRLLGGKTTLRVSERLYREGAYKAISPRGLIAKYREHIRFRKRPVYMLCAGAYTAADFKLIHAYPDKLLKWGYFPPLRIYDESPMSLKPSPETIHIVWAGRFIPLKHPEYVTRLAKDLDTAGISFHIHFIGAGELERELRAAIEGDLEEKITFYGFLSPDDVRDIMEKCHIHLCTSNRLEGWGAVVNEGMNSGCVEIVSDRIGAAPYLIDDGRNGLTYSGDSYDELREQVMRVSGNWSAYRSMGVAAYETIRNEWNAETAANRLYSFLCSLSKGEKISLPKTGPLSKAPIVKPGHKI